MSPVEIAVASKGTNKNVSDQHSIHGVAPHARFRRNAVFVDAGNR